MNFFKTVECNLTFFFFVADIEPGEQGWKSEINVTR